MEEWLELVWSLCTWENISQVAIMVLTTTANILTARRNKWGWIIGLAAQPFWFVTAVNNKQFGIFVVNITCTAIWLYGVYYNWIARPVRSR